MTAIKDYASINKETSHRRIESILNWPNYTTEQKKLVDRFYAHLQRKGLRLASQKGYLQQLKLLLRDMPGDPLEWSYKDIDRYLLTVSQHLKPKSIIEKKKFLFLFLEWLHGKKKEDIDIIKDIILKRDKGIKLPEELLTPDEIKQLVRTAGTFRDKALIIMLYETAARRGEFLQLKIKHIDLSRKEYAFVTLPMGKTDSRRLPLIFSVPHLTNWINSHPDPEPESPLFPTHGSYLNKALGEDGLKTLVKTIAKQAGIKKRVYPHLFRHSRLTELGKELREQELKVYAGWCADSGMAKVYVHLSGEDVTNKMLANAGLTELEHHENGKSILSAIKCPRCDKISSAEVKHCTCGFVLDIKEVNRMIETGEINSPSDVNEISERLKKMEKVFEWLADKKEILEAIERKV